MAHEDGAGLAAPQIGESVRVVIFGVSANPRYPDAEEVPFTVLVNPVIEFLTEEIEEGWEGCLSVPGLRGVVPRRTRLRYTRLRRGRPPHRPRRRRLPRARGAARVRPPRRHPLPHAHAGHEPLRLHGRDSSPAATPVPTTEPPGEEPVERVKETAMSIEPAAAPERDLESEKRLAHILYLLHAARPLHRVAARGRSRSSSAHGNARRRARHLPRLALLVALAHLLVGAAVDRRLRRRSPCSSSSP